MKTDAVERPQEQAVGGTDRPLAGFGPDCLEDDGCMTAIRISQNAPDQARLQRVSVIMPVWNCGAGCLAAINGVLLQTWRDVELIIVDDGSDDGDTGKTEAGLMVLQAVAESRGLNVRVERIEHAGCSAARNRGLEVATGRWVAYNDADDISAPGRLEAQVRAMEREPWAVGCYCGVKLSTGVVVEGQEYSRGKMLAGYGLAATSALMVDRERVGDIRHRDDTMDGGYKLEVTRRGPLSVVREPMVTYRVGGGISALRGWRANREIDVATYMRELEWAMLVNRAGEIAELRRSLRRVRGALRMGGWLGVRSAMGGAVVDRVARLLWPPVGVRHEA